MEFPGCVWLEPPVAFEPCAFQVLLAAVEFACDPAVAFAGAVWLVVAFCCAGAVLLRPGGAVPFDGWDPFWPGAVVALAGMSLAAVVFEDEAFAEAAFEPVWLAEPVAFVPLCGGTLWSCCAVEFALALPAAGAFDACGVVF